MQIQSKDSHIEALAPRLLLVDDDPTVLRGLSRLIRVAQPQCRILLAVDGQDALEVLEQHPVHTLIADLQMPRMDGKALLSHAAAAYPETIRIVHSSLRPASTGPSILRLAHAMIPKPVNPTSLIAVLDWALGHPRSQVTSGGSAA